ncbi:MAG: acyl-CoA synthetase FdrA [Anaerolineales bacterium]|nr:acyl-CoA synthetase FdrA [Anaerolineales bacterium]
MTLVSQVKPNTYYDSVRLMRVSEMLSQLPGVSQAIVAMGTEANKRVLAETNLLAERVQDAGANDLMLVVEADSAEAGQEALTQAEAKLTEAASPVGRTGQEMARPRSLVQARQALAGANMALVSVPGPYAKLEVARALQAGMHVFLFSDNVTLAEELELKQWAVAQNRLMMGPGCGTAIINGVALAFANAVRRGPIGVVAASGTGLQEVTCLLDRGGSGISQAIGVGGRDLSETIGGLMMQQGLAMLAADPETELIVLISKPPAPAVTEIILDAAQACGKPVIVSFLGSKQSGQVNDLTFTSSLEETAEAALRRINGTDQDYFGLAPDQLKAMAAAERDKLGPGQHYLRGLFSGGSLCDEAMLLLADRLPALYSNIPLRPEWALADGWHSREHSCIDMGEEEFTQGRPHPMIDPRLRQERLLKEASDPSVAVILLDVVIGYGSHSNPAGALVESIQAAKAMAAAQGRYLAVVAHVCGTDQDPQGLPQQERILREAGVLVLPTNAQAARVAAAIVS